MAKPSEAHVEVARRLLAHSRAAAVSMESPAVAARAYDVLFQALAPILGAAGFRALFARSVKLAKAEYASLEEVRTNHELREKDEDPVLGQIVSALGKLEPVRALELATGLYAMFYALVTTFIGESLVEQIVKGAFPAVDATDPEVTE